MNEKQFYVYIMASRENGAIYIGVTSDLIKRVYQHKNEIIKGHTSKYNIKLLVHYEIFGNAEDAILRKKRLKKWTRPMKNDLITTESFMERFIRNNSLCLTKQRFLPTQE